MRDELARRQTLTDAVVLYFKARPGVWINAKDLLDVGGFAAWRTRVSEARALIEAEGGTLENRQQRVTPNPTARNEDGPSRELHQSAVTVISEYRFLPHVQLGRDASEQIPQKTLFELR